MKSDNYAQVLIAEHLSKAGQALVPQIMVGSGEGGKGGGTLVDVLLGSMIRDQQKKGSDPAAPAPQAAHLEAVAAAPAEKVVEAGEKKEKPAEVEE
jgi:hypothetical protein